MDGVLKCSFWLSLWRTEHLNALPGTMHRPGFTLKAGAILPYSCLCLLAVCFYCGNSYKMCNLITIFIARLVEHFLESVVSIAERCCQNDNTNSEFRSKEEATLENGIRHWEGNAPHQSRHRTYKNVWVISHSLQNSFGRSHWCETTWNSWFASYRLKRTDNKG